jgi:VanZ family protein
MKKQNKQIERKWAWWVLLGISLGAIYWVNTFEYLTGERTKVVIEYITGIAGEKSYSVNAFVRKSVHVVAYGFLSLLLYRVSGTQSICYPWIFTTMFAILDEWHQSFVPDRTPLIRDVLLDSAAAMFFLLIAFYLKRQR